MPINVPKEYAKVRRAAAAESKRIGAAMAAKRNAAGFKAGYIAAKMGVSKTTLSDLEHGRRYWQEHHIASFLAAIGETTT